MRACRHAGLAVLPRALLRVLVAALLPAAAQASPPGLMSEFTLDGPTVVVFVRASAAPGDEALDGDPDLLAVQALQEAQACLGEFAASYRFIHADRIVVRGAAGREAFDLGYASPLTGALLLDPAAPPRIVFAGGGPRSLADLVTRAAADYFRHPCPG